MKPGDKAIVKVNVPFARIVAGEQVTLDRKLDGSAGVPELWVCRIANGRVVSLAADEITITEEVELPRV